MCAYCKEVWEVWAVSEGVLLRVVYLSLPVPGGFPHAFTLHLRSDCILSGNKEWKHSVPALLE